MKQRTGPAARHPGPAAVRADTDAEAERLAATADFAHLRRTRGEHGPLVSAEKALAGLWSSTEEAARRANRRRLFVGSPERVRDRLAALAESVGADEIMVMTAMFDHAARRRSSEQLAGAFRLDLPGAVPSR